MRCKHEKDREQFDNPPSFVDMALFTLLRGVVQIIDLISVISGCGEIWITCYIAERSYSSQHPEGLAVDIRCHQGGEGQKPLKWYWFMDLLGIALHAFDERIVFIMHKGQYGKLNEHIHVHVVRLK